MLYITRLLATILIPALMQMGLVSLVSTSPEAAVTDFLEGLKTGETHVMEKHMDNQYVNFLVNVQGDEEVVAAMNEALFQNFSYDVEKVLEKNQVAVARVVIQSNDFSKVKAGYDTASYDYIVDNLYSDSIADKKALNAKCLELYVQQIQKAAEKEPSQETIVFIPLVNDGYYGWNVAVSDELMKAILGNLEIPTGS